MNEFEGPDYLLANYHQSGLFQVNRVIQILNNLEDEWYDEKQSKLEYIERLKNELEKSKAEYSKSWLKERIEEENNGLKRLNAKEKPIRSADEENLLDNTLIDLVNRKVKKFKLIYNNSKNLFLEFRASKRDVRIILPNIKQHIKNHILHDSDLDIFRILGFYPVGEDKLVIILSGSFEETLMKIKTILIKIVFDIFCYYKDSNQSFIEFDY